MTEREFEEFQSWVRTHTAKGPLFLSTAFFEAVEAEYGQRGLEMPKTLAKLSQYRRTSMTADEQEALSVSHRRGLWCVPLSSGRIAVFPHPARSLRCICDTWEDVTKLEVREPEPPRQLRFGLDDFHIDL